MFNSNADANAKNIGHVCAVTTAKQFTPLTTLLFNYGYYRCLCIMFIFNPFVVHLWYNGLFNCLLNNVWSYSCGSSTSLSIDVIGRFRTSNECDVIGNWFTGEDVREVNHRRIMQKVFFIFSIYLQLRLGQKLLVDLSTIL